MKKSTLSLALMSGKGGVGKSNLALNLGYALAIQDFPVLLLDCDLGLANQDVLLGIRTQKNLLDVLNDEAQVSETIIKIKSGWKSSYDILPAASGVPELVEMNPVMRDTLFRRLEPELANYDFVILDLGAGISDTVQAFAAMAAIRVVVLTPEPTSLTDSYALIKILYSNRGLDDFYVLVNQVENSKEEKDTYNRLSLACEKFISFKPKYIGSVRMDPKFPEAVRMQKPLLELYPNTAAANDIKQIAAQLESIYQEMKPELADQPVFHPLL